MIKIIVCSDSHGAKAKIDKLFEEYNFNYFIFLGDGISDLGLYDNLDNVYMVRGNCDIFSSEASEKLLEFGGKRFLITHGNNYGVKYGMGGLIKRAEELRVDVALFGHTHTYYNEKVGSILYANPGSVKSGSAMLIELGENIVCKSIII